MGLLEHVKPIPDAATTSLDDSRLFHPSEVASNARFMARRMARVPGLLPILSGPLLGLGMGAYFLVRALGSPDVMLTRKQQPWSNIDPSEYPRHLMVPHPEAIDHLASKRHVAHVHGVPGPYTELVYNADKKEVDNYEYSHFHHEPYPERVAQAAINVLPRS